MKDRMTLCAEDHLGTSDGKRQFNAVHFAESAPRYDVATRGLSLGQDGSWKRALIAGLPEMRAPVCLDVACGTGDVAQLLASRYPDGEIHGLDLTPAMIEIAHRRDESGRIHFAVGDMGRLDFADASADLITGSYAIRNAPDLDSTLAEFARVLRPGGCAAFLDFSKPAGCFRQAIQSHLLRLWGGFWGLVLHGNPRIHGYISSSLRDFPDEEEILRVFARHHLHAGMSRPLFFGMMRLHFLHKES
jgi:demethylmenaquinone methyltransferase/2-methoxy-6-polyprenyl-1,4-benzoquinol methylase